MVSVSAATAAYAFSSNWTTSNRIEVTGSGLAVYLDAALTQPAQSSNDYGAHNPGDQITLFLWIRNGGTTLTLHWASSLNTNSVTGYVSNIWVFSNDDGQSWQDLSGRSLAPSAVLATKYVVFVSTLTPAGTYTWSLTLSGS